MPSSGSLLSCLACLAIVEACGCQCPEYTAVEVSIAATLVRDSVAEAWTLAGSSPIVAADGPDGVLARYLAEPSTSDSTGVEWGGYGTRLNLNLTLQLVTPLPMALGDTVRITSVAQDAFNPRWGLVSSREGAAWLRTYGFVSDAVSGLVTATGMSPLVLDLDLQFTAGDSASLRLTGRATFAVRSAPWCF